jgi:hypothetical protein
MHWEPKMLVSTLKMFTRSLFTIQKNSTKVSMKGRRRLQQLTCMWGAEIVSPYPIGSGMSCKHPETCHVQSARATVKHTSYPWISSN